MNRNQWRHNKSFLNNTKLTLLAFLITVSTVVPSNQLRARERIQRRFDQSSGLVVSTVFSLAQDAEGFIWIGTAGGLVRYDGTRMRPWAKEIINRDVSMLAASRQGETLLAEGGGSLYRVNSTGVEPVYGPEGQPFNQLYGLTFDSLDRPWVVTESGSLYFREGKNDWKAVDVARTFPGEHVRRIRASANDKVYVLTKKAVWEWRPGESARRIADIPLVIDVVEHPDGSLYALAWLANGDLLQIQPDGTITKKLTIQARPIDLVVRGNVLWASFSHYLVAVRGAEPPDIIGRDENVPSGGPLLVDHEGSLWLGTFSGLLQYPEPETTIWSSKDGLSTSHTRTLAMTDEAIWVGAWGDLSRITREASIWRVYNEKIASLPCSPDSSRLFATTTERDRLLERRNGGFVKAAPLPKGTSIYSCHQVSNGRLLLATSHGILVYDSEAKSVETLPSPVDGAGERTLVLFAFADNRDRLWSATIDGQICHAPAQAVMTKQSVSWSCQPLNDAPNGFDIIQLQSGNLWLSNNRSAIWRLTATGWEPIPASRTLSSQIVFHLTPSPSGGVWLAGSGTTMRVVERTDNAQGWEVVEVLSAWEGLLGSGAEDILEEPDGDLWLSTSLGVIRVPVEARKAEGSPPRVKLVDVIMNGRDVTALDGRTTELPYGSQVELHFAALSYRDRSRLQYQYRLGSESPWIGLQDNSPVLRFVDLGVGDYSAEIRASLDGVNWTAEPARLVFQILNPWYLRPVTLVLFLLIVGAALYAAHRARIGVLMRLERQRARIAMDLHDEMGSGLGSIGILSGLAAQDGLEGVTRRDLAEKIAVTASELGTSLAEIVWALKPGAPTLEGLAYHVAERAGRLFPSNEPSFTTNFPTRWPKVALSLAVRRNILLIASEALHNAARHSRANQVTFGVMPGHGKRWRIWIADDGVGVTTNSDTAGSGIGLRSMRRRAEEISAEISWAANNGRGTIVSIDFDPTAEDRRLD